MPLPEEPPHTGEKSATFTVCIDPGHPSEVGRGTKGRRITEIEAAWRVALLLRVRLEKQGMRVVLTKTRRDQRVTNRERARIANRAEADLMVRLHCDAARGSGIASYAPDRKGTARDGTRGPSDAVIAASRRRARLFHAALTKALAPFLPDLGLKSDAQTAVGGRQGALTGSIFSEVPVVLVEMCVLTNPKDEAFIASQRGQERMADALAKGVAAALKS